MTTHRWRGVILLCLLRLLVAIFFFFDSEMNEKKSFSRRVFLKKEDIYLSRSHVNVGFGANEYESDGDGPLP